MLELNKDNFENEVIKAAGTIVVDFWSESCELCLELMPDYQRIAEEYGDKLKFAKLDIKGSRRLAMSQQVMGLPSFVFYVDGKKSEHLSGEDLDAEELEKTVKEFYEQA
ncbi:MAG: thioredoxin family protein [Halanaerobiales bacterium]|nr:thioredoxin family protein [Halanaerobiales bacterium]